MNDAAEEVRVARIAARRLAGRLGVRDYRELLSGCWVGAREGIGKGLKGNHLYRCCESRARDQYRTETGAKRRARPESLGRLDPADRRPAESAPFAAWGESKYLRAGMPPRARVLLYLIAVEGYTRCEAAALVGLTKGRVSQLLNGLFS